MHQLFFILIKNEDKKPNIIVEYLKSEEEKTEIRFKAYAKLNHPWFVSDRGRGMSDWYVIGGRWSGVLTKVLGKKPAKDMEKFNEAMSELMERKSKMGKLNYEKELKETQDYAWRDTYNTLGYEDDSMILTKNLINGLKNCKGKKWLKDVELYDSTNKEMKIIKDLNKNDIGKIIVVVDYHN